MNAESKPRTPEDIDAVISAELPDPSKPERSELFQTVLTSQLHGPCGERNPRAPCCMDGACDNGYPKEFQESTVVQVDGYPKYRRRQGSPAATKGAHPVDARDVVPYIPYLSRKYSCHLNPADLIFNYECSHVAPKVIVRQGHGDTFPRIQLRTTCLANGNDTLFTYLTSLMALVLTTNVIRAADERDALITW